MKIVRFAAAGRTSYGTVEGDTIRAIRGTPYRGIHPTGETFSLNQVRLLPPCKPSKVVALGVNYRMHAEEMGSKLPGDPLIFLKPPTTVIGPEEKIVYPPSSSHVDFEGELGAVIGRRTKNVSKAEALDCVLGYTCFNDVTARDLQASDRQWTRSKGFDTFGPAGPWIVTGLDPSGLLLETYVNGELKQHTSTADLIYDVPTQISFISQVMTLLPGDIIATGTPSGVGPMQPGDTVEVKIESIGTLRNYVVAAKV